MQMGRNLGMCIFDDSLLDLVRKGTISKETARRYCEESQTFWRRQTWHASMNCFVI